MAPKWLPYGSKGAKTGQGGSRSVLTDKKHIKRAIWNTPLHPPLKPQAASPGEMVPGVLFGPPLHTRRGPG